MSTNLLCILVVFGCSLKRQCEYVKKIGPVRSHDTLLCALIQDLLKVTVFAFVRMFILVTERVATLQNDSLLYPALCVDFALNCIVARRRLKNVSTLCRLLAAGKRSPTETWLSFLPSFGCSTFSGIGLLPQFSSFFLVTNTSTCLSIFIREELRSVIRLLSPDVKKWAQVHNVFMDTLWKQYNHRGYVFKGTEMFKNYHASGIAAERFGRPSTFTNEEGK